MNGFYLKLLFLGCEFHFWLSEWPADDRGIILMIFKIFLFEIFFSVNSLFAHILSRRFWEFQDWLLKTHIERSMSPFLCFCKILSIHFAGLNPEFLWKLKCWI